MLLGAGGGSTAIRALIELGAGERKAARTHGNRRLE